MASAVPPGFELTGLTDPYSVQFGPVYIDRDTSRLGFRVEEKHLNPVGTCHGGAISTFADMQIMLANEGVGTSAGHTPTISLTVDYLAPPPLGAWVVADVEIVKRTRTLIFTQALIHADGDQLVARTTGIYRYLPPRDS